MNIDASVDANGANGANGVIDSESDSILTRMDTVQALLNSLVGRTDTMSMETTTQLQKEMTSLRIRRTKLKPLSTQVTVLEKLVYINESSCCFFHYFSNEVEPN